MTSQEDRKLPRAAVLVILAVSASLPVIEGSQPGLQLSDKPADMTRSVKLKVENEVIEETVHVDTEKNTETFRTASSTGTSLVITDMEKGLTAYRFDDDDTCYILNDNLEEAEGTEDLLDDLGQMKEGEVDPAEESRAEEYLTVDKARGQVDPSELSDSMAEFCEGLQASWAVKSSVEPPPTPAAFAEAEEARQLMELENLRELNGGSAVQHREKRVVVSGAVAGAVVAVGAKVAGNLVCRYVTRNVCARTGNRVCGRRRRALPDGMSEPKTSVKRGWLGGLARWRSACRTVFTWRCNPVRTKVCFMVG